MLDPFNYLTGSVPVAVNGVLQDAKRRRNVLPRVGVDLGSAGAPVDAPGNRHLLFEVAIAPNGVSIDKPFVASVRHPRDTDWQNGSGHRRSVGPGVHRLPADATSIPERRWTAARSRSPARRSRRPSKTFSTDFPCATKTAVICSRSRPSKPASRCRSAGAIQSSRVRTTRRPGFKIFEALIGDSSGSILAVWMNQSFLQDILKRDVRVVLFGAVEARPGLQLINPDYEVMDAAKAPTPSRTTRRPRTRGASSRSTKKPAR